jgi:G3E family GTPase
MNEPKRFVFQGVHMILDGDLQRDWKPDELRQSKMVFIGRKLDRAMIEKAVEATRA